MIRQQYPPPVPRTFWLFMLVDQHALDLLVHTHEDRLVTCACEDCFELLNAAWRAVAEVPVLLMGRQICWRDRHPCYVARGKQEPVAANLLQISDLWRVPNLGIRVLLEDHTLEPKAEAGHLFWLPARNVPTGSIYRVSRLHWKRPDPTFEA
jgi:hypothetical protein